ncbi:hypothetical protein RBSH_02705 [Rhodopirellula baltica SH28]|uniref:Uncharacterized protein n=1 Tax=Rhodopirellula baltica SH28 TaxID=993517 RepID=K5D5L9_RHOBT|nr:hypothetical protein RBSH_02705 [Rhodopirellula baltica SH28]
MVSLATRDLPHFGGVVKIRSLPAWLAYAFGAWKGCGECIGRFLA